MKKPVLSETKDYLALLIRRKWWVFFCFLFTYPATTLIVLTMPDIYVSETTILVEPKDVPDDMVRDLISVSTEERMSAVQQTILSRTNLLRVANEFESELTQLAGLDDERRIQSLAEDISIETSVSGSRRGQNSSYFKISYESQDPSVAQRVTSRLASLFVELDSRSREAYVFGTVDFLGSELDKAYRELQSADEELTSLKKRFSHELPEYLDSNQRALDRLQDQAQANQEALDRSTALRLSLERQISEISPVIVERVAGAVGRSDQATPSPLVQQFRLKEREYNELRSRYKEAHPSVQQLKAEMDALRDQIPPEDLIEIEQSIGLETTNVTRPNPAYQALQKQLDEISAEIDIKKKERDWIQGQIGQFERRIDNTPSRERQIASVQRTRDDLSALYDDLNGKLADARLSQSLESRQKGSQFQILDPANFPMHASKPNRPLLLLLAFVGCLGLGAVVGFLVDFATQKFWTYTEVEKLLGLPVLAEIPGIVTEEGLASARRRKIARAVMASSLAVLILGTVTILYGNLEFRGLAARHLGQLVEWTSR